MFPFLRHGNGSADELRLWVVLADPSGSAEVLKQGFEGWAKGAGLTAAACVEGPLASLRARGLKARSATLVRTAEAKLDQALLAAHERQAIGLVVRDNRVEPSEWHQRTLADSGAVLSALEKVVCRPRRYAQPGAKVGLTDRDRDLRDLLLATTRESLEARLVEAVLAGLRKSAGSAAEEAVVRDVLLERLPGLLGFDFDTDVVVREALAIASGLSATSFEMSPQFNAEVERRTIASHRHSNTGARLMGETAEATWQSAAAVRKGMARKAWFPLQTSFDDTDSTHTKTLLALTAKERLALVSHGQFATLVANSAVHCMTRGNFRDALTLYDAAVEGGLPAAAAANPLYAVQDDNNHLGIDAARSRRYLERCLPHGPDNPTIFLNASFVCMELGEPDRAIELLALAKKHGIAVKTHRNERLFSPLRERADFKKLMR